jgi:hypothetical protein
MDFNGDILTPASSRARNEIRERDRRLAAEAKATDSKAELPPSAISLTHINGRYLVLSIIDVLVKAICFNMGWIDGWVGDGRVETKDEKKTVVINATNGEQKIYRQLNDDHLDDDKNRDKPSPTPTTPPNGIVDISPTHTNGTATIVTVNDDDKIKDPVGDALVFVPTTTSNEQPPLPGIVVTPVAAAGGATATTGEASSLSTTAFGASSTTATLNGLSHPTSVASSSLPPVRPPGGSIGRAPPSPNNATATANAIASSSAAATTTTATSLSSPPSAEPAAVASAPSIVTTNGGGGGATSTVATPMGAGGGAGGGATGAGASPLAVSPTGENTIPLSFNTLPSSGVTSSTSSQMISASGSALSSSVLTMPSPAATGPIFTRFPVDWNSQSKKDLGRHWPPEVLEQLLRYFDTPSPPNCMHIIRSSDVLPDL